MVASGTDRFLSAALRSGAVLGSAVVCPAIHGRPGGVSLWDVEKSQTVDASGGKFLITAVPAEYEKEPAPLRVPGSSWLYSLRSHAKRDEAGQRSFAIDETGVIRAADLGTTRPVTRDEVEKWKPLQ